MTNLLLRYQAQMTAKNALAVHLYARKHPFAVCLLTPEMSELLSKAIVHGTECV